MLQKNKLLLPVVVLVAFVILAKLVTSNPPEMKRRGASQIPQLSVDVQTITRKPFTITVTSYGIVKPRTKSVLLPQVSGQIVSISDSFRPGGFFEQGDILLTLDDRDLAAEVKVSQANLFTAQQSLIEEKARAQLAKEDWARLGNGEQVPNLVSREPQLLAAQAKLSSAEANLARSQLALERTKIVAPYSGRILTQEVDVGQVISPNTRLAEMYAVDYVEVRLPIKNKDLQYMQLPENTRGNNIVDNNLPNVNIFSDLTTRRSWQGNIVRTEGALDENSQQLYVVAQINDPYGTPSKGIALKMGQYVSAEIEGNTINDALIIPNKAIYQGSYVYIVDNGVLHRKKITIAWQNENVALIDSGLEQGQKLVLTPLGQVTSGTRVSINGQERKVRGKGRKPNSSNRPQRKKGNKNQQGLANRGDH